MLTRRNDCIDVKWDDASIRQAPALPGPSRLKCTVYTVVSLKSRPLTRAPVRPGNKQLPCLGNPADLSVGSSQDSADNIILILCDKLMSVMSLKEIQDLFPCPV